MHARSHSHVAFAKPRRLKRSNPIADLIQANGGSPRWLTTDVRTLAEIYMHERTLRGALRHGAIRTHGQHARVRTLPQWLQPSRYPLRR